MCTLAAQPKKWVIVLNLTFSDTGTRQPVHVGDQVSVALDENPTTGYRWQAEFDDSVLRAVDDTFEAATGASGAGGTRRFTFDAVGAGTTELRLRKCRSWKPDEVVEEFAVSLDVS
jgi:inhibitor of cysteine peptidase